MSNIYIMDSKNTETRELFSDDRNSLMNFVFGVSSVYQPVILPIFMVYLFLAQKNDTKAIISEYGAGFLLGKITK